MKIRLGFVSNSSSSSFIATINISEYHSLIESYSDIEKCMIAEHFNNYGDIWYEDMTDHQRKICFKYMFITDNSFRREYRTMVKYLKRYEKMYHYKHIDNNSDIHSELQQNNLMMFNH